MVVRLRAGKVRVPLAILPVRSIQELLDSALDILALFRPIAVKAYSGALFVQLFFEELRNFGPFDLVDIEIPREERVRIKVLMR